MAGPTISGRRRPVRSTSPTSAPRSRPGAPTVRAPRSPPEDRATNRSALRPGKPTSRSERTSGPGRCPAPGPGKRCPIAGRNEARRDEQRRRRRRRWLVVGARAARPAVRGRRRVVRLAALRTGRRWRAGERQRPAGVGREGDRQRAREQGRRRVVTRVPDLVPRRRAVRRRPARTRCASTWG